MNDKSYREMMELINNDLSFWINRVNQTTKPIYQYDRDNIDNDLANEIIDHYRKGFIVAPIN